jgi:hypothetical protein
MAGLSFLMSIGGHYTPTIRFGQLGVSMKFAIKTEV